MGFFFKRRDKRLSLDPPKRGSVFVEGKRVPISLKKATTRFSSQNNVFVGYEVGSGKFKKRVTSELGMNKASRKLLKAKKGLSGKGEERGVTSKPLYQGRGKK